MNLKHNYFFGGTAGLLLLIPMMLFGAAEPRVSLIAPTSSVAPGALVSIIVSVESAEPLNAASLTISYPPDHLVFTSRSTEGSPIDFWKSDGVVVTPGEILLEGGARSAFGNPPSRLMTLYFRATKEGEAALALTKAQLYLADGKGTRLAVTPTSATLTIATGGTEPDAPSDGTKPYFGETRLLPTEKGGTLLVFTASDKETGIPSTTVRFKHLFFWSKELVAQSPLFVPAGVWKVEIISRDTAGNEAVQYLTFLSVAVQKTVALLLILLIVWIVRRVHRNRGGILS